MLAEKFTIRDDFPPASYEQWRQLAEAALDGAAFDRKLVTRTYEGIDVQPVYTRADLPSGDPSGFPGMPPFVRGAAPRGATNVGWDLRQEHRQPDLKQANQDILDDLSGGVTSLLLRFSRSARAGLDADNGRAAELNGLDGLMVYSVADFDRLLEDVQLDLAAIVLDAGGAFLPAAALLVGLWRRHKIAPDQARGAFHADPLAALAADGHLPTSAERAMALMARLAAWTADNYPHVTAVGVDTAPYHHAGATAVEDVAFAAATGVEYLRAMIAAGMDISAAARQIQFRFSLGTHHFLEMAKLRAARKVWARVVQVSGGSSDAAAMRIHARTSNRTLTRRDPYVNLLRNTASVFAAGLGGAQAITSAPFDHLSGPPDAASRRIARNTVLILQEEAHLHRVIDPAGGSWFLETATESIAQAAWTKFQEIEERGGMLTSIQDNWVAEQIDAAFAPRAKDIARRKAGITGVSEFPDVHETPIAHETIDSATIVRAARQRVKNARQKSPALNSLAKSDQPVAALITAAERGATIGQMAAALGFHKETASAAPLVNRYFAEPFEKLRDATDAWTEKSGTRPRIFLANLGPVAHHAARAAFSKNFFEAGGFEVVTNDGFEDAEAAAAALAASGARVAVICSSDKLYPDLVPSAAESLKAAGARTVVLAGSPGEHEDAWRAAGVDRFIYISCEVLAILREILREEGVIDS